MRQLPKGRGEMAAPVLLDRLVSGQRGEIDEVGYRRAHLDDLRRLLEPHQQRADSPSAAELLEQLRGDVGAVEPGHDQHIGRAREPAERIALAHQRDVEGHFRAHLAVISKSTLRASRMATASRTRCPASPSGLPKFEYDSSATRGAWPIIWRARRADCMAMSASSSAPGSACSVVSAMNTERPRDSSRA